MTEMLTWVMLGEVLKLLRKNVTLRLLRKKVRRVLLRRVLLKRVRSWLFWNERRWCGFSWGLQINLLLWIDLFLAGGRSLKSRWRSLT